MTGPQPKAQSPKPDGSGSTSDNHHAYVTSLRLLGRRELSVFQLRQRLQTRGFSSAAIDATVDRLIAERALDDRRTARAVTRTELLVKRRGPHRVRRQLEALGIERDLVEDTLRRALEQIDQRALLDEALARRLKSPRARLLDAASFRRLHAQLVRQGFSSSAVTAALKARRGIQPTDLDDQ